MFYSASAGVHRWLVALFVQTIGAVADPDDRRDAINWLLASRDILAADLALPEKLLALNGLIKPRTAVAALAGRIAAAVMGYRHADVSWAVKIAIPTALFRAAMPVWPAAGVPGLGPQAVAPQAVGPYGAGLAAFGTAVGLPAMLLIFLGASGIAAVIAGVVAQPQPAAAVALSAARILQAEAPRRAASWFVAEMINDPVAPEAAAMPREAAAIPAALLLLDPRSFERHVMSFFERAGLRAVVTPNGREHGLDGYAHHSEGLIAVQCRRHGMDSKIGSPAVERFRAVMADGRAWRGYLVTTSCFTAGAVSNALREPGLHLVDVDELVRWHGRGLVVAA